MKTCPDIDFHEGNYQCNMLLSTHMEVNCFLTLNMPEDVNKNFCKCRNINVFSGKLGCLVSR